MLITNINNCNINFKASQLNILATADNHGNVATIPQLIKTVEENKEDIFQKSKEKSTLNLFAIAGDYFMYPDKKGLATKKDELVGDLQYEFLLKMVKTIKDKVGKNSNFDTVFALGNHDLEAGDKWVMNKLKDAPVKTILTNVKLNKSPFIENLMESHENIVTSKIYEISDDKRFDVKNHVLILGLTIPRSKFHGKTLEGTQFYDKLDKSDSSLVHDDFIKTYKIVDYEIKKYKSIHPSGAVVVMSHLGNVVSKMLAEEVADIDVILNAHDHKKSDVIINDTLISSLGENNKFIKSINIKFDDYGKLNSIDKFQFNTDKYAKLANEDKDLQQFVYENIRKDIKPLLKFNINSELAKEFEFSKDIRNSNSAFVNFVTSGVKEAAQLAYPSLDVVGIPSKVFRGGLKHEYDDSNEFNNLDLIRLFGGASAVFADLKIGEVTGIELAEIIVENVLKNIKNPKDNGIMHWSDIQVNKTLMEKIKTGESELHYIDAIKIKNHTTKEFEALNPYKNFTIMLPNKYLLTNMNSSQLKMNFISKFVYVEDTYTSLFKEYLDLINYHFELSNNSIEQRII